MDKRARKASADEMQDVAQTRAAKSRPTRQHGESTHEWHVDGCTQARERSAHASWASWGAGRDAVLCSDSMHSDTPDSGYRSGLHGPAADRMFKCFCGACARHNDVKVSESGAMVKGALRRGSGRCWHASARVGTARERCGPGATCLLPHLGAFEVEPHAFELVISSTHAFALHTPLHTAKPSFGLHTPLHRCPLHNCVCVMDYTSVCV